MTSTLGIFRGDGKLLHASASFATLLCREREARVLLGAAHRFLRDATASLRGNQIIASPQHIVRTRTGRYLLRISAMHSVTPGVERLYVMTIHDVSIDRVEQSSRERFALTAREAEIVSLLATGQGNSAIATLLRISPHTARHHTERILRKLGVSSRAQVSAKLAE